MSKDNSPATDPLTKDLLKKCEVTNLCQFYHKWLKTYDHIVPIKQICAIQSNFHENKVMEDIKAIHDIVWINIVDFTQKRTVKDLTREKYLVDALGLGKLLRYLKRRRMIAKSSPLPEIYKKLGISKKQGDKALSLINLAIKKRIIYASVDSHPTFTSEPQDMEPIPEEKGLYLNFYSRLKHPEHRKEFIKLIVTAILGLILISILLPLILFINSQA